MAQEVGITTYRDGSAWDICLLNMPADAEVEICTFLMQMRHDIEISYEDGVLGDSVIFTVEPSELIGQYVRKWAKDRGYKFDRATESSK